MVHDASGPVGTARADGAAPRPAPAQPLHAGRDEAGGGRADLHLEAQTPEELAAQWEADKPLPAGTASNVAAALVVAAIGAVGVVGALALGVGSASAPRAGTWPLAISVVLIGLAVALLLASPVTRDTERFTRESWGVLAGLATMAAFAALISRIGFEIPALLLAFVWLKFLGHESWRVAVVGSVLMVGAFYAVFVVALSVSIPHLF